MKRKLSIRTKLARNGVDTFDLRGHDIRDVVDDNYWSVVSLSLGNRRLTRAECRLIDTVSNLAAIGDPRIWPLKIARLVGSYGQFFTAMSAGYTVLDRANIGPRPAEDAARFFAAAAAPGQTAAEDAAAICAKYDAALANKQRVPAFGVAGRDNDERCLVFMEWLETQDYEPGRYWRMYLAAIEHMEKRHGLKPNIIGPMGIVPLDLGFDPDTVVALASFMPHWGFVANAFEGTRESPEVLRRLPADFVRYVGPAPRISPRAAAAAKADADQSSNRT